MIFSRVGVLLAVVVLASCALVVWVTGTWLAAPALVIGALVGTALGHFLYWWVTK